MPAVRERTFQDDWSHGFNRDVAPQLIPEEGCYDLVNGLLDEDGNPYLRGGTGYKSNAAFGTSGLSWVWDGHLLPGQRTIFANEEDFGVLDADDETPVNLGGAGISVPKQAAALQDLLFIGGGAIYGGSRKSAEYSTGTVKVTKGSKTVEGSGTSWSANVDEGMLFQIGDGRVYIVASVSSNTKLTLRDDYEESSGEGKSYALRPIYSIRTADPYIDSDYYAVCANRLVAIEGNKVRFTEVNDPHSTTNHLGTSNEHELPEGVEGVGLATSGQTQLIFSTHGVWSLDGLALSIVDLTGNPQHRLQLLSGDVVLAGAAGLASTGQQIVVPAIDGIYLMDGVSGPERISNPIDRLYWHRIAEGYLLGGATVYRGHYFLPILEGDSAVRDMLVCRVDRSVRSRSQTTYPWTRFSGDGGEVRCFSVRISPGESRQPVLLGAQSREPSRVVDASSYFTPGELYTTDADGSERDFDLITRDIPTGARTENIVRRILLRYELWSRSDETVVKVYWSDGALEAGEAEWDEVTWDAFDWAEGGEGAIFNGVSRLGPPSDGRQRHKFPINQRLYYGRFRIMTSGEAAAFALRLLEMDVRPSGAVRR